VIAVGAWPAVAGAEAGYGKVMHGQMSLEYSEVIVDEGCERQAQFALREIPSRACTLSLSAIDSPGGIITRLTLRLRDMLCVSRGSANPINFVKLSEGLHKIPRLEIIARKMI